jgi:hypothetical protein
MSVEELERDLREALEALATLHAAFVSFQQPTQLRGRQAAEKAAAVLKKHGRAAD